MQKQVGKLGNIRDILQWAYIGSVGQLIADKPKEGERVFVELCEIESLINGSIKDLEELFLWNSSPEFTTLTIEKEDWKNFKNHLIKTNDNGELS